MKRYLIPVLLLALQPAALLAAPLTGAQILQKAMNLREEIKDYTATIHVVADIPGMSVPERTATVYFKRPNKFHIESKGIVMIPRRALMMGDMGDQITKRAKVVLTGTSKQDGVPTYSLKVIPYADQRTQDRILVWVRGDNFTVEKMEMWASGRKELSVQWQQQLVDGKYWLAKSLTATFERRMRRDPDAPAGGTRVATGKVSITFSNVKVNTGLSDDIFKEDARNAAPSRSN